MMMHMQKTPLDKYVVERLGDDKYDVIHLGPYVVSKSLRLVEALALAAALNAENKDER